MVLANFDRIRSAEIVRLVLDFLIIPGRALLASSDKEDEGDACKGRCT
jgi:hypothetical protein